MKEFNVAGKCIPSIHYMVDITDKLEQISKMVDGGKYFVINRARQYGKTTTLSQLRAYLKDKYYVLSISFEAADEMFESVESFVSGFIKKIGYEMEYADFSDELIKLWNNQKSPINFQDLGISIVRLCKAAEKNIILLIDEVDKSSNNPIFVNFLGMLRNLYLERDVKKTFQSVILAGVYDIKNLKLKIRPKEERKYDSPWNNIAVDFDVDMSLSVDGIAGMLCEYESDYHTGMNIEKIAKLIFEYTEGYPFLVSYICEKIANKIVGTERFPTLSSAWSESGVFEAVRMLVKGPNTLYDDMIKNVEAYPELYKILNDILFENQKYSYHEYDKASNIAKMFGFIKEENGEIVIANRIFKMQLYSYFLVKELKEDDARREALPENNQFIKNGMLDMDLVMRKFYDYYKVLNEPGDEKFLEKQGRKIFLMYLKPIINGSGNFYIEDQSSGKYRTDIVVDYKGKQFVIELKIWHGEEYNRKGQEQLREYMRVYNLDKGYLLSYDFNKNKHSGVREIEVDGKKILEVVV